MGIKRKLWCFYDLQSHFVVRGLTLDEGRAFTMAIRMENRPVWQVWCEGWTSWHPMVEVEELRQSINRKTSENPPPLPEAEGLDQPKDPMAEEMQEVLTSHNMNVNYPKNKAKGHLAVLPDIKVETDREEFIPREFPRYSKKMRVEIESNGRKFVSHTVDVSVGGALLEDALPDWIVGYSLVYLINTETKEMAELTCCVVDDDVPGKRFRLEFSALGDPENKLQLDYWLQSA